MNKLFLKNCIGKSSHAHPQMEVPPFAHGLQQRGDFGFLIWFFGSHLGWSLFHNTFPFSFLVGRLLLDWLRRTGLKNHQGTGFCLPTSRFKTALFSSWFSEEWSMAFTRTDITNSSAETSFPKTNPSMACRHFVQNRTRLGDITPSWPNLGQNTFWGWGKSLVYLFQQKDFQPPKHCRTMCHLGPSLTFSRSQIASILSKDCTKLHST